MIENWCTSGDVSGCFLCHSEPTGDLRSLPGKERFTLKHFCQYTSRAPHVDCSARLHGISSSKNKTRTCHVVFLPGQHDFGCSIVARRDISRHLRVLYSCKSEIAYLPKHSLDRGQATERQTLRSQFSFTRILPRFLGERTVGNACCQTQKDGPDLDGPHQQNGHI